MSASPPLPLPAPVAAPSAPDLLNPTQWKILMSICDTIILSVHTSEPGKLVDVSETFQNDALEALPSRRDTSASRVKAYLEEGASTIPEYRELLRRIFIVLLLPSVRKQLLQMLSLLSYSAGSVVLTGRTTIISEQPLDIRQQIIQGWVTSRFGALRLFVRQLTLVSKQLWLRTSPNLQPILGLPRMPVYAPLGKGHEFNFIQLPPGEEPETLETDIVIIGSGCGGGVCAKELAEAGIRVIVVDKGYYWSPEYFPMTAVQGPSHLFMNEGQINSDDGSVNIVAGSTWGGGGTINWSASLQPQGFVRREWAAKGLPFFTSTAFQESIDRVCDTMGVSAEHIKHSKPNALLLEGSRKLGWAHAAVPQNTGGSEHSCGHCHLGCRSAEKQGPAVSWLPRAASAGARFMEGLDVKKIEFTKVRGHQVVNGIRGTWKSRDEHKGVAGTPTVTREVFIQAKKVIVSCGSLQSPLLLLRSGLTNYQIGRNLYLHPVSMVGAVYDEETRPWDGPILTSVSPEFENLDGHGHGVKLEATNMLPWSWLTWAPWTEGLKYKQLAAKMNRMAGFISVPRDRDPGRVYPDSDDGRCRIQYHPSNFDKANILEGLVALARISYVTGAREIFTIVPGFESFVRKDGTDQTETDAEFETWITKMQAHGFPTPETYWISAHQMGSCRMSAKPKDGVVAADGHVWGTKGLYVADASVFPTASGVNPSVTVMSIADHISRLIAAKWAEQKL
ncbi:long chain fatty alcohol oxidase [Mariannaea sp. PMI_226]|nr:long chain fatty alcohol oxidase [Mariannaea sp. PMI_226]